MLFHNQCQLWITVSIHLNLKPIANVVAFSSLESYEVRNMVPFKVGFLIQTFKNAKKFI